MNSHHSAILALGGLALVGGTARAQYNGDPGLDPRVANFMPPPIHVEYQCDVGNGAPDTMPVIWPGGLVPVEIDPSNADPALTVRAMDTWMFRQGTSPNVTFVWRDPANPAHANYVRVYGVPGAVSGAQVGMQTGQCLVNQGSQVNQYVMAHEFCHVLGFWHEHTRPERDSYVWVYYERVTPQSSVHNFNIQPQWVQGSLNTGYDFDSVMHYHATSFMAHCCDLCLGNCISVLTCTPLVARPDLGYGGWQCLMGQQDHLSTSDVQDVINVYGARQRPLSFVGPNGSGTTVGTLSYPYSSPAQFGGGGDVYFKGGSSYQVARGARFNTPGTWRKHSTGIAAITAP